MSARWGSLRIAGLLLLLTHLLCTCDSAPVRTYDDARRLERWTENASYYAWNGTEPVLLLGAGNDPFLKVNYREIIREASQARANLVVCELVGATERSRPPFAYQNGQFDLAQPDSIYWAHLRDIASTTREFGGVLELLGSAGEFYPTGLYQNKATFKKAFSEQVALATGDFQNIIHGYRSARGEAPFNYALLTGAGRVDYPSLSDQQTTDGRALSAVRAARSVEKLIKFWDLSPAPDILLDGSTTGTIPARDSLDNYVIHLNGPGRVRVRLNTESQVPIRVTVIGYLGTRRSEVLQPPYGSVFELSTEDERGAWLVMKRLD